MEGNKVEIDEEVLKATCRQATQWQILIERLNGVLENYTEKERETPYVQEEIKIERMYILKQLTKYIVNW